MIQDKTLAVLGQEKQELIKRIDAEKDKLKRFALEEQLQSLEGSIDRYRDELLQKVESSVEKELAVVRETPTKQKRSLWAEYRDACDEYKDLQEQVSQSRQRKKEIRIKLGIDKTVRGKTNESKNE